MDETTTPGSAQAQPALVVATTPVASSSIAAIGYDAPSSTLAIVFTSGAKYHYEAVPAEVWQQMQQADSVGRFYAQHIRGKYTGTKQA